MSLKNYIMSIRDFTPSYCQELIADFENEKNKVVRDTTSDIPGWGKSRKVFTEMNMSEQYNKDVVNSRLAYYQNYVSNVTPLVCLPAKVAVEGSRMKRYDVGEEFDWHTDVGDKLSSSRILVMMTYLNDDFEGGETEFQDIGSRFLVKPITGMTVVFPATYMFPHRGRKIISGSKYIINSYIHFL